VSLRQSLHQSAACVRVRILGDVRVRDLPDGDRQEVQRIRVEKVLSRPPGSVAGAGLAAGQELDVFYHAEGLPHHDAGDVALVFLDPTAERPEFASLAAALPWYSVQGPGDEWVLRGSEGERIEGHARAWLAWLRDPAADLPGLRALLLAGLDSGVDRLEADSVSELVRLAGRSDVFEDAAFLGALSARATDPSLPLARRVALLRAVEARLGDGAGGRWAELVAGVASEEDAHALARLAGPRPDPAVAAWLRARVDDPSPRLRRAIWQALSRSATGSDVGLLARGAGDADPVVARAAIQGLGAVPGDAARVQLETLARDGGAERSRWAAAALRRQKTAVTP
jgi:hypothetical protein